MSPPNDLPDFTTQTSQTSVTANDVTIVEGQSGVNVSMNQPPYLIGSYTTPDTARHKAGPFTLQAGTHGVFVIAECANGNFFTPKFLGILSNTTQMAWPIATGNDLYNGTGHSTSQNYFAGIWFVSDIYDTQILLDIQEQSNGGNTYRIYGVLDSSVVLPASMDGNPTIVQGPAFTTGAALDSGLLQVCGPATPASARPIAVTGNSQSSAIPIKGVSGAQAVPITSNDNATKVAFNSGALNNSSFTLYTAPAGGAHVKEVIVNNDTSVGTDVLQVQVGGSTVWQGSALDTQHHIPLYDYPMTNGQTIVVTNTTAAALNVRATAVVREP